jgi:arylsulfatase A-like enzyme/Tfp pilus assembly protein PilF
VALARRGCGAALLLVLGLAACGRGADPVRGPQRFVLVTIDTLRADHIGCYGDAKATTPTLDALAARGVRFETAISPAPLTLPSHATLLTALDPPEHGVRSNGHYRLPEGLPTLAERMREAGFGSAAFVSAFVLDRRFGLARGFDHYDDRVGVQDLDEGVASRPADQTVDAVLAWLEGAPERFFLWVHFYDPHAPYVAPEAYQARQLGRPYDAEITFADAELGRLLAALDERFGPEGTVAIVTSDHGESLGEHGEPTHAFTLYEATQRIPLLMAGAGLPVGVVVSQGLARLADVAPSVLELAGLPGFEPAAGRSLLPLARGEPEPEPRLAWIETLATQLDFGWSPLLGVRTAEHKYIRAPRPELFALATDPKEEHNLASAEPERVRELDAWIEAREPAKRAAPNLAPGAEVTQQLRALGYVAAEPQATARAYGEVGGADPKDQIGVLAVMQEALQALFAGREARALELLAPLGESGLEVERLRGEAALRSGNFAMARAAAERALRLNPGHAHILVLVGRVAEAEGQLAGAAATFRRALELEPESAEAWIGLGRVAEAEGRIEEARERYAHASDLARVESESVWRLAALEIESGRFAEARSVLSALPQRLVRSPEPAARLALAERRAGRRDLATLRLSGALRVQPAASVLLLAQADVHEEEGREAAALAARRKAHAADPDDRAARLALARSLALVRKDLELARELAEDCAAHARSAEALEVLALVRSARGEYETALALSDEALAGAPEPARPGILLRRAEALAGLGRIEEAARTVAEARALAGDDLRTESSAARVEKLIESASR